MPGTFHPFTLQDFRIVSVFFQQDHPLILDSSVLNKSILIFLNI